MAKLETFQRPTNANFVPASGRKALLSGLRKASLWICGVILVISLAYLAWTTISNLFPQGNAIQTIIPAVAGLLGALIGAVSGAWVSLTLQRDRYLADAMIQKKKTVYEPLYNALKVLDGEMKWTNNFEQIIRGNLMNEASRAASMPPIADWPLLSTTSVYYEVPEWLRNSLDQQMQEFKRYPEVRALAQSVLTARVIKIASEKYGVLYQNIDSQGLGWLILNKIHNSNVATAQKIFQTGTVDLTKEQAENLYTDIINILPELPEVQAALKLKDDITNHTVWLINELAAINEHIRRKYERQNILV